MKHYPINEKTVIGFKSLVYSGSAVFSPSQKILWGKNGEMISNQIFRTEYLINNEQKVSKGVRPYFYYGVFGTYHIAEASGYIRNYYTTLAQIPIIVVCEFWGKGYIGTQGCVFDNARVIGILKPVNDYISTNREWDMSENGNYRMKLELQIYSNSLLTILDGAKKASAYFDVPLIDYEVAFEQIKKMLKNYKVTYRKNKADEKGINYMAVYDKNITIEDVKKQYPSYEVVIK